MSANVFVLRRYVTVGCHKVSNVGGCTQLLGCWVSKLQINLGLYHTFDFCARQPTPTPIYDHSK